MKHIKLFEAYLDPTNNILCDVEDMCLELKDNRFIIDIERSKYRDGTHYK